MMKTTVDVWNWRQFPRGNQITFLLIFTIKSHHEIMSYTSTDVELNSASIEAKF